MLRYTIGLVALLTIFSSCSTDLNLTGAYEEVPLIYGLLDPNDNPNQGGNGHLFRIQKAFLGEESAFVMALEPDSSYFPYDDLFVELVEYNGATESNRWVLDTVMISNKDVGDPDDGVIDFFGPSQRLYSTANGKILEATQSGPVNIDANKNYEITLKKRPLGITNMTIANMDTIAPIADAITEIVNPASIRWNAPNENSPISPGTTRKMDLFNNLNEYKDFTVRFDLADRAVQYEMWLRFYYREVISGVETRKSFEWKVSTFEPDAGATSWQLQLSAQNIYSRIGSEIEVNPEATRYLGIPDNDPEDPFPADNQTHDIDIFLRMAGKDLYQYISINDPSNSGALTDKPPYTNVNNGLGVLSSRSKDEFRGMYLSPTAVDHLIAGEFTQNLGFVHE